ncbi:aldehyde dehydrogenase family protein [Euzebya sp.]|uniref:aldehyde dehydrogenase family protein n=1 Tax=Euzebya sp. TaxID=1971409 RepID=UPI003511282D
MTDIATPPAATAAVDRIPLRVGSTGDWAEVRSPFSGDVVGEVELADATVVDQVLGVQRALFTDRARHLPHHERAAILRRAAALAADRAEALALQVALEGGKPLADARVEVARGINGLELAAEEGVRLHGEEVPMRATAAAAGRLAFTTREPIGLVAAVSAFNHPFNLIVHQVAPAVAAGCPVAVKPASATPLSAHALVDLLIEAGLPPEWSVCLPMPGRVAESLVTDPRIAFLTFIGSGEVGWGLRRKVADGVRCAMEHGGAAPLIVDAGADLAALVPKIVKGGYYHAGQVCVSVQRVFAVGAIRDELVDRLRAAVARLVVGDPTDPATEVGPLITQTEADRVAAWVDEAVQAGASLVAGGAALDRQCYAPTILVDPPVGAKVRSQEVFGPVVDVVGVADLDAAIAAANEVPFSFQASICTPDVTRAMYAAQRIDANAVMVNDHTAFRVDWMPFGGRRVSGLGLGGIPHTLAEMTAEKLIVLPAP